MKFEKKFTVADTIRKMSKPKKFITVKSIKSELPDLVDALFEGNHEAPGEVFMNANAKGRECIGALFPRAYIAWYGSEAEYPDGWRDWRSFTINLPDVIAATETKLPLEITGGANLDEAQPAALALLLAIGVTDQGGRSALVEQGALQIFHPSSN